MIIVSGALFVDPAEREAYLDQCRTVIVTARASAGCQDFHLSADPLEPDRINVYEQWDSAAAVDTFRGGGPTDAQASAIREARVFQHEVAASRQL